ncbi:hypothetical protein K503DRAFT_794250 [Rhizopogon vinicolor AM-OR11-026]|uniref:Uncharacterized protein n=1 Tax=Rhizopogon vinicolor AM-OR11-026 TaxID=1314800 RepID=A0A1B7MNM0_9AGAM|nr:hypothetical protein K503DRAFT_794250 [Rhizopogon vinicolor AM-OR11-026]
MYPQGPLNQSPFNLDSAGLAGFFGGDETISAMATVHLYRGRRWLGWYNSPGSYSVAKRYGQLANSRFWDGLFPGPNPEPAEAFGLDGKAGPRYVASLSGTDMTTGHLAYLLIQRSKELDAERVEGRPSTETLPAAVTVVRVGDVTYDDQVEMMSTNHALLATIPITVSFATCFVCAVVRDWFAFSLILLGILSSGISCFVVGTAKMHLQSQKNVTEGVPPGDGLLLTPRDVVVLKGAEKDVNAITKGKFFLDMRGGKEYRAVGLCSLLLVAQFLIQLLLTPQATLFGQIMFLSSFAVSWMYNSFLSSLENEKVQGDILCKALREKIQQKLLVETLKVTQSSKFKLGTRTTAAVFTTLVLRPRSSTKPQPPSQTEPKPSSTNKFLKYFLPNETAVWDEWREHVGSHIEATNWTRNTNRQDVNKDLESLKKYDSTRLSTKDEPLFAKLLKDAVDAFEGYYKFLNPPGDQGDGKGNRAISWSSSESSKPLLTNVPAVDLQAQGLRAPSALVSCSSTYMHSLVIPYFSLLI